MSSLPGADGSQGNPGRCTHTTRKSSLQVSAVVGVLCVTLTQDTCPSGWTTGSSVERACPLPHAPSCPVLSSSDSRATNTILSCPRCRLSLPSPGHPLC